MTDQETAQKFADILQDAVLEVDPTINFTWKRMFGGAGYYANGRMFAAWYRDEYIALKLAEPDRNSLLGVEGTQPVSKNSVELPDSMLNDRSQLAHWTGKSIDYIMSLPMKKKRK